MNTAPMNILSDARLAAELAAEAGELLLTLRAAEEELIDGKALGRKGDQLANVLLLDRLSVDRPNDSVLSEESVDDKSRLNASRVWIIDPLDGTREFSMPGRGDWAVHVALWEAGRGITAAAVAMPVLGTVHASDDVAVLSGPVDRPIRIVVSDSRPPAFTVDLEARLGARIIGMGSAGAKAMAVVRGDADAYVHAGGQWEWDSAAPVGVALAAGLHCSRIDGSPLRYNESHPYLPDLVICRRELAASILEVLAASQV